MNKEYIIVTDSTSDLPADLANELGLTVLPLTYKINDKEYANYLDYREQSVKEFYELIKSGSQSVTSQLIPQDYIDSMTPHLEANKDILVISFSSKLSGTYNSGRLAIDELQEKYPNNKIIIIDSKSASLGEGMLVYLAAKEKEKGLSIDELTSFVESTIPTIAHWFTVDDIQHLRRGGRISAAASIVAKALSIKPIMHCSVDGELVPRNKAISRKKAIKNLYTKMTETAVKDQKIAFIGHGDDIEAAETLKSYILETYPNIEIIINNIGPVIGSHTGQGVLALFYVANER